MQIVTNKKSLILRDGDSQIAMILEDGNKVVFSQNENVAPNLGFKVQSILKKLFFAVDKKRSVDQRLKQVSKQIEGFKTLRGLSLS